MKFKWKDNNYVRLGLALFGALAGFWLFYTVMSDFSAVFSIVQTAIGLLMPFVVGFVLAYLLAPIYDHVERPLFRLFAGKEKEPRRFAKAASKTIATIASVLLLIAVFAGLLSLVIPEAISSIGELVSAVPDRAKDLMVWVQEFSAKHGESPVMQYVSDSVGDIAQSLTAWAHSDLLPQLGNLALQFSNGLFGFLGTMSNVFIGLIICIYALNSKELFAAQAKKVVYSFFKTSTANYIVHMTRYIDQTFGRYINGMLLDALVLGTMVFVGMSILGLPYAPLVAVIVGVCNLIPMFGPFIGAAFGCFFVLMKDPLQALFFVIFFTVIQQLDANFIAPRILGGKTGLSSFWVIFAIVLGGGLFGVIGMILAVPTFAVVYSLFRQYVSRRLQKKKVPDSTEAYQGLWDVDEVTGEPKYTAPSDEITVPQYHSQSEASEEEPAK
ncbi:MAG: AI-2E family transporter [Clostridia bacterium]|nr:AI-2E family transporter [Clostridia bacterium]